MRRLLIVTPVLVVVLSAVSLRPVEAQDHCSELAKQVLSDPKLIASNFVNVVNSSSCFFQANASIEPAKLGLINALENLSGSQQQGSSVSSAASTNVVSKPSGPTSLVEEFGGVTTTSGTSSMTLQWAPGTMFTNLSLNGVVPLCLNAGDKNCLSAGLLKDMSKLTLKVTGNTSGNSQMTGSASSSSSSAASAQPVSVSSSGNSGPSFSGLTVQYTVIGSKTAAGTQSATKSVPQYLAELNAGNAEVNALQKCSVDADWKTSASQVVTELVASKDSKDDLTAVIEDQYRTLYQAMRQSASCKSADDELSTLLASVLEAAAADIQQATIKPEVAVEYDLNTPRNQPSYSSAKVSASWQFGKVSLKSNSAGAPGEASSHAAPASKSQQIRAQRTQDIKAFIADTLTKASSPSSSSSDSAKQQSSGAKSIAAQNAQPWSVTLNGVVDIYNSHPPSSVPSGTHWKDLQGAAEISYLFAPTKKSSGFFQAIGGITTALAYSYQDQTSPSILTGPALNDFVGLPSSTTAAYVRRGVIHLGQAKLGFGTGSNISFPLVFTYSNRTQLVVNPTWGLNFGVSYNLNSLFSSASSTKQ